MFGHSLDEFKGQGQRLKVKVTTNKTAFFGPFRGLRAVYVWKTSVASSLFLVLLRFSSLFAKFLSLDGRCKVSRSQALPPFRHVVFASNTGCRYNWTHCVAISALNTNSLRRRCCDRPTAHCNESRDPVDLLENLCLRCKLCSELHRLANSYKHGSVQYIKLATWLQISNVRYAFD